MASFDLAMGEEAPLEGETLWERPWSLAGLRERDEERPWEWERE